MKSAPRPASESTQARPASGVGAPTKNGAAGDSGEPPFTIIPAATMRGPVVRPARNASRQAHTPVRAP